MLNVAVQCEIIGDSLAVGTAQYLPCKANAHGGISSMEFLKGFNGTEGPVTIISLGSNAYGTVAVSPVDRFSLTEIRKKIHGKVIWMLPPSRARELVGEIAGTYHDDVVDVRLSGATVNHIHPNGSGYKILADKIREKITQ